MAPPSIRPMASRFKKWFLALLAALVVLGPACARRAPQKSAASRGPIVVAAAISLKDAFGELANLYTARTGVKVDFSFGASGELMKQIEAGAPVDIFASAGEPEMNELQSKGLVDVPTRADFARNALALVVPRGSAIQAKDFRGLLRPAFKRISMGNPKTVPAGMYAEQLLRHLGLWPELQPRLIFAENVRQALEYVERGEVSAGIVYATDVPIARGRVVEAARAPEGAYGPILYPIGLLRGASHPGAAGQFEKFVLSRAGQDVLANFGFLAVKRS